MYLNNHGLYNKYIAFQGKFAPLNHTILKLLSMKAIVLKDPGGVENLVLKEIAVPVIKDHEVLVKVKAISINPVEATLRNNGDFLRLVLHLEKDESPVILGWDISGVVEQTGKAVTRFHKGDEVFGMVNFTGHGKAYAEYVAAPESHLTLKPASVSHKEAAAATLAALTAWQTLVNLAGIKADDKVLIHSASGGVGHYAVQIAKHLGAYVIGTSSAANKDLVLSLGADEHIDYSTQRFEELVQDADIVVDSIRDINHLERSLRVIKSKGKLISLVAFPDERLSRKALMKRMFLYRMEVASDGTDMQAIAGLLEKGHLRSHISRSFSFDEIPTAHQHIESGHTTGKIVLEV
jgi:NADPH:quinone reductase-like Zn-dependent oxidoreductase